MLPRLNRRTSAAVLATAATLAGGVAGLAQGAAPANEPAHAAVANVSVRDNFFSPRSSSTRSGRVTFTWRGSSFHDLVFTRAPGGKPRGCSLRRRGSCTRRLRRRGTYSFVCTIHSGMGGKIRRR